MSTRYFLNVETGVANIATPILLKIQHKRTMADQRLMPEGWKPGDKAVFNEQATPDIDAITAAVLAKMQGNNDPVAVAEAVKAELSGTVDEEMLDAGRLQELIACIGEMDPTDKDQYTNGGKPDAKYMSKVLGGNVSASERDEAFDAFQQLQG